MMDMDDRTLWGVSQLDKEKLDEYWNKLMLKANHLGRQEVKYFLHCTTLTGKKSITKCRKLIGGKTNLPAKAPLASNESIRGVWLAMSPSELPRRSPYGTQRMVFKSGNITRYLGKELKKDDVEDEDHWDAPDDEDTQVDYRKKKGKKKKDRKKETEINRKQKPCYLKDKLPIKDHLSIPLLFFECTHFYGTTQYVRLLLVRQSDPKVAWCQNFCKELDIHNNPFLQLLHGRIYTYNQGDVRTEIVVEVLVVGDIIFEQLQEPPDWDEAEQLKVKGNEALSQQNYAEAERLYTEALTLDNDNAVLYSNRSASHSKAGNHLEALQDAEKAIEIKPNWVKGWSRKGTALCYLNRYEEAKIAFEEGLKLEPDNEQLKEGLAEAESYLTGPGGSQHIRNPFAAPGAIQKLEANPKTREYLKDPLFRTKLGLLISTNAMQNMNDPRILTCLGVLLGFDFQCMGDGNEDSSPMDSGYNTTSDTSPFQTQYSNKQNQKSDQSGKPSTQKPPEPQSKAVQAKEKGNEAYKAKKFEEAVKYYDEAIALDPNDMTFLNNKAAVYFEMQQYDECIATCEKAVEVGREHRADFTNIAKAFARIGKSYLKKGDEQTAVKFLNKSLSEHRASDVAKLVLELEKQIKEKERLAYINPEKSVEEKNKGNDFYQQGKYPEALKHYSEAIKRNPMDAKLYSNRAACYTKLMEFNLALRDCDDCIKLEPTFIKGFLRKGAIYTAMKDATNAIQAYQKALELDPQCDEAQEGYRSSIVQESSDPEAIKKRAMADPEVQAILQDPAMRIILEQMQNNPNALREHLKDHNIASKIEKLLEAGIIAIR